VSIVLAVAAASIVALATAEAVEPGSQPIGCEQADTRLTIAASSHLDPACTWTRGVDIVASDVVLDCQGARIATTDRRCGILVSAPADTALANVVVRSCHVEGFLIASRMGENTLPMDCSDPAYLPGVVLDHAEDNVVRSNVFRDPWLDLRGEREPRSTRRPLRGRAAPDEPLRVRRGVRARRSREPPHGRSSRAPRTRAASPLPVVVHAVRGGREAAHRSRGPRQAQGCGPGARRYRPAATGAAVRHAVRPACARDPPDRGRTSGHPIR
jgi:hypothetical protein